MARFAEDQGHEPNKIEQMSWVHKCELYLLD